MIDMQLEVIGDEIYYGGYLVGVFAQDGVPASVLDEFRDGLENATLFESTAYETVEQFLESKVKPIVKGGLVRYKQLAQLAENIQ